MEITPFDTSKYFKTEESQEILLQDAIDSGDSGYLAHALGIIAKNQGMTKLAKDTDLARESLYRSLSETGDPKLSTVLKVLKSLGLKISITALNPQSK
ncbi:addiction module antidote protein [Bartonella sp. DGB1]|uniref:addiction module antidote protein n=1 Tax=Bartonella sp. DGB1 TaxID=3239807 RepID=UPI003523AB89